MVCQGGGYRYACQHMARQKCISFLANCRKAQPISANENTTSLFQPRVVHAYMHLYLAPVGGSIE